MSTVAAMASSYSSLNPDAPLFIPAAYRQVEDFSPEWWELVKTTAWFRDHWFRQNHHRHLLLHDADAAFTAAGDDDLDVAALLPDDLDTVGTDDLFYAPDVHQVHQAANPALLPGYDLDVLRALSLSSPGPAAAVNIAPSPRAMHQQRHADKPTWHDAGARAAASRRGIHQPR